MTGREDELHAAVRDAGGPDTRDFVFLQRTTRRPPCAQTSNCSVRRLPDARARRRVPVRRRDRPPHRTHLKQQRRRAHERQAPVQSQSLRPRQHSPHPRRRGGSSSAAAPPVGPLPSGPTRRFRRRSGSSSRSALPHRPSGRVWRIARAINSRVLVQVGEADVGRTSSSSSRPRRKAAQRSRSAHSR